MANPAPDCLITLLGLAPAALPCYSLPADFTLAALSASAAGTWLSDVPGLQLGPTSAASAATDLYAQLDKARRVGAGFLRADLEAGRAKSFGAPLYQQRGTFGGPGNGQLAPAGTRARLQFYTNYRPEAAWRISRLSLYTDGLVTDAPLLLNGQQVALLTGGGAAGTVTGLPIGGLQVPLDGVVHTLEVVLPADVRPRLNSFFAGCFSCQAGSPWSQSVKNSVRDITATTPGNGLALSVNEECVADADLLCYAIGADGPDQPARYPELARHLGLALLFKAAEQFTVGLLASRAVNRYTMLEPKDLSFLATRYASEYATRAAWLNSPAGLGQVQHPCYEGPAAVGPYKIRTT